MSGSRPANISGYFTRFPPHTLFLTVKIAMLLCVPNVLYILL